MDRPSTARRNSGRCRFHHSIDEWNRQKPRIVKYYIDQGHFIERTINIMKNRHQFNASRRMYMKMLRKWNINKHTRKDRPKDRSEESTYGEHLEQERKSPSCDAAITLPDGGEERKKKTASLPSFPSSIDGDDPVLDQNEPGALDDLHRSAELRGLEAISSHVEGPEHLGAERQPPSPEARQVRQTGLVGHGALVAAMESRGRGDLSTAEELCKAALSRNPYPPGVDNYSALHLLSYLATIHAEKQQFAVAEAELTDVLEQTRALLGNNHLMAVSTLSSLAQLHSRQGHHARAEPLFMEIVRIHEMSAEQDVFTKLRARRDLANNYFQQRRYHLAKSELEHVVETARASVGPADPYTEEILWELLHVYDHIRELEECESIFAHQHLGTKHLLYRITPDHDAMWTLRCLAYVHILQDQIREALRETLFLAVLSKRLDQQAKLLPGADRTTTADQLCPPSGLTLTFEKHVSSMMLVSGLFEECLMLNMRLLPQLVAAYDFDHPIALDTISILGQCNTALGSFHAARKQFRRARDGFERLRDKKQALRQSMRLLTCLSDAESFVASEIMDLALCAVSSGDQNDRIELLDVAEAALRFLAKRHDPASFKALLDATLPTVFQILDTDTGRLGSALGFLAFSASELDQLNERAMADQLVSRLAYEIVVLAPVPRAWSKKALECVGLHELRRENWKEAEMYLLAAKFHSIHLLGPIHAETKKLDEPIRIASENLHKVSLLGPHGLAHRASTPTGSTYHDLPLQSSYLNLQDRLSPNGASGEARAAACDTDDAARKLGSG